jgi:hypothetical protein
VEVSEGASEIVVAVRSSPSALFSNQWKLNNPLTPSQALEGVAAVSAIGVVVVSEVVVGLTVVEVVGLTVVEVVGLEGEVVEVS